MLALSLYISLFKRRVRAIELNDLGTWSAPLRLLQRVDDVFEGLQRALINLSVYITSMKDLRFELQGGLHETFEPHYTNVE